MKIRTYIIVSKSTGQLFPLSTYLKIEVMAKKYKYNRDWLFLGEL